MGIIEYEKATPAFHANLQELMAPMFEVMHGCSNTSEIRKAYALFVKKNELHQNDTPKLLHLALLEICAFEKNIIGEAAAHNTPERVFESFEAFAPMSARALAEAMGYRDTTVPHGDELISFPYYFNHSLFTFSPQQDKFEIEFGQEKKTARVTFKERAPHIRILFDKNIFNKKIHYFEHSSVVFECSLKYDEATGAHRACAIDSHAITPTIEPLNNQRTRLSHNLYAVSYSLFDNTYREPDNTLYVLAPSEESAKALVATLKNSPGDSLNYHIEATIEHERVLCSQEMLDEEVIDANMFSEGNPAENKSAKPVSNEE